MVLSAVAIPLAPFLYREHIAVLVLLRPTKDVFLLAGYLAEEGRVSAPVVIVAALPLMLGGVWVFYGLGRGYRREILDADLPGAAGRLLPPDRIRTLSDAVDHGGARFVFLGRLAAFPSSLVAASAGAGGVDVRRFCLADGLGALTSMTVAFTAGFLLEEAYSDAGPWLSALGLAALVAAAMLLGRYLRAEARRSSGS